VCGYNFLLPVWGAQVAVRPVQVFSVILSNSYLFVLQRFFRLTASTELRFFEVVISVAFILHLSLCVHVSLPNFTIRLNNTLSSPSSLQEFGTLRLV
jgi:hypothetical protein